MNNVRIDQSTATFRPPEVSTSICRAESSTSVIRPDSALPRDALVCFAACAELDAACDVSVVTSIGCRAEPMVASGMEELR